MIIHLFKYINILIILNFNFCLPEGVINSDKKIHQVFKQKKIVPSEGIYTENGKNLKYVITGENKKGNIIFIHGSPGSWDNFLKYLSDKDLTKDFLLISIDRPGFGKSNPGKFEPSLQKQSDLISAFIKSLNLKGKSIFLGHSFGGPVVAKIAMDYPELVNGILFIAASIDPDQEEIKWFNNVADWKIIRWIIPESFDVSNQEILPLKSELTKILPDWKNIKTNVIFIQGGKDSLVPPENANFAKRVLVNSDFKLIYKEDLNHFIPWTNFDLVKSSIYLFNL
ncbi:MAG: alpha/beta hydrolase [Leptospiraceae bacterium]|nr:alpha/beta hydrolase [Leptospiraceae bacterium]